MRVVKPVSTIGESLSPWCSLFCVSQQCSICRDYSLHICNILSLHVNFYDWWWPGCTLKQKYGPIIDEPSKMVYYVIVSSEKIFNKRKVSIKEKFIFTSQSNYILYIMIYTKLVMNSKSVYKFTYFLHMRITNNM